MEDRLVQLTQDDVVHRQKNGREKNYLINYIGKSEQISISKGNGKTENGAVYIVCSDGLYKHLKYEDVSCLCQIDSDKGIEKISQSLIFLMMERGEKDNISCAVLKV